MLNQLQSPLCLMFIFLYKSMFLNGLLSFQNEIATLNQVLFLGFNYVGCMDDCALENCINDLII